MTPHLRYRRFNTAAFDQQRSVAREMCMAVRAGDHIFLRGQSGFTLDGRFAGLGDAAAQAEQAMRNVKLLLEEAGAGIEHLCKLTTYITDRAWRAPVDAVIGRHLGGVAPAGTGLIVGGLAAPEMLVEIDAEAVIPDGDSEVFLSGIADPAAAAAVRRHGHSPAAAAEQAEAVFALLRAQLRSAGARATDVCKLTMQITDRAYRQPVYGVLGRALAGVWPVSTGLIVAGLPDPDALFQLDAYAVAGGPHERLRRYRSSDMRYGLSTQSFSADFCMAVRAGRRIFLRGQTGMTHGGELVGGNDPAAQARQAVDNVRTLLADAGADLGHATRLVTYVTDRASLGPVLAEVEAAFAASPVASTELVVKGLAAPEILMEIDVHAMLPLAARSS